MLVSAQITCRLYNFMIVLYAFLAGLHTILVVLLVCLVLIQKSTRSKSLMNGGFAPRGSTDLITYITAVICALNFINTIVMSKVANSDAKNKIIQQAALAPARNPI